MLTPLERLLFLLFTLLTLYLTLRAARRLVRIISRGHGRSLCAGSGKHWSRR